MAHEDTDTKYSILQTLCYFDVFQHPLNIDEIQSFANEPLAIEILSENLEPLHKNGIINHYEGYYFLKERDITCVQMRKDKEARALGMMRKARFIAKGMAHFPFVDAVCLSGSMSKGIMSKDGDLDYFIITKPGRLWIARTMLVAFKKIFLLNSHRYFCPNYFVDRTHLQIPDRNLFTATEILTLHPMVNQEAYKDFLSANNWTRKFLPSFSMNKEADSPKQKSNALKVFIEWIFSGILGEKLDNALFRITLKHWKRKFPAFNNETFDLRLRTRKTVSKHHPQGYQDKVLSACKEKMKILQESIKERGKKVA